MENKELTSKKFGIKGYGHGHSYGDGSRNLHWYGAIKLTKPVNMLILGDVMEDFKDFNLNLRSVGQHNNYKSDDIGECSITKESERVVETKRFLRSPIIHRQTKVEGIAYVDNDEINYNLEAVPMLMKYIEKAFNCEPNSKELRFILERHL